MQGAVLKQVERNRTFCYDLVNGIILKLQKGREQNNTLLFF